ncbi:MAG: 30S ribosomal protein S8 [Verrucomicrobiae bacterium]|nr:30S ribosomal protein S8 [Verrucomicrobiae bacterium]MDW8308517.1 30S ribosomal protein S8 [Verrucomicrobiales bacterium]
MTDPIADMLTRIRNAGRALQPTVEIPHSRLKEGIARILRQEGYIADFTVAGNAVKTLKLRLKYTGKKPVIEGLRRMSKPGRRLYVGVQDIPRVLGGMGIAVLSTSEGIMTGEQARRKHLGGELLCLVW